MRSALKSDGVKLPFGSTYAVACFNNILSTYRHFLYSLLLNVASDIIRSNFFRLSWDALFDEFDVLEMILSALQLDC